MKKILFIKGLTLELKENKKRCETAEEELAKFKKENDKELSRLIQHYEQRVSPHSPIRLYPTTRNENLITFL